MRARAYGAIALGCFGVHAVNRVGAGDGWSLLWACHVASVLVGVGLVGGRRGLAQVGVLWLCLGNMLWVTDLLFGEPLRPTSALTHVGGIVSGALGVRRLGGWRAVGGLWVYALLGGQGLILVSRLVTPPAENVNLAFAVHGGSAQWMSSFAVYHLLMAALAGATFWVSDRALRRLLGEAAGAGAADLGRGGGRG